VAATIADMTVPGRAARDLATGTEAAAPISVLWLYGPPGVGKTTVAWEIYSQLTRAGVESAYVDIDQLGMCYPEHPSDPGRHLLKARNLAAVVASFAAAGARSVIVSGVVDPDRGVDDHLIPEMALVTCRLRAEPDELRQRFIGRSGNAEAADDVLQEAAALDASDRADVCIDTSSRSAADVARDVVARCGGWSALIGPPRAPAPAGPAGCAATGAGMPVLFLCGATGVGKSTVGFEIYMRDLHAGCTAAYVDLDQLGFCYSAAADDDSHAVKARSLAAIWANYQAAGAQQLIMVGPVDSDRAAATYAAALPAAVITLCRLHAGPDELAWRIRERGHGGSWPQPGDPLAGQSPAHLRGVADQAASDASALERAAVGALRIDTDGRTATDVADLVVGRAGWPRPPRDGNQA
jgi:adenylylsulfate kinase-like enzyme